MKRHFTFQKYFRFKKYLYFCKSKQQTKGENHMCQISRETVIRANRRMIEHKPVRGGSSVTSDGSFRVSVAANGKIYRQTITREQVREAYGKALKKNGTHGA